VPTDWAIVRQSPDINPIKKSGDYLLSRFGTWQKYGGARLADIDRSGMAFAPMHHHLDVASDAGFSTARGQNYWQVQKKLGIPMTRAVEGPSYRDLFGTKQES